MKDALGQPESASRLSAVEVEEIARHGIVREYRARAMVVAEGERTDGLYVILGGRVKVFCGDIDGREIELAILGTGEYFGELAIDHEPRSASVITLEASRLLAVEPERFAALLAADPAFATRFIGKLVRKVRALTRNVRSLALADAGERVAQLLLDEAVETPGARCIPRRLTQAAIARRVGCSREMVSRILKDLGQRGCISVEPGRIVIKRLDPGCAPHSTSRKEQP